MVSVLSVLVGVGAYALLVARAVVVSPVVSGVGGLVFVSGTPTPPLGPAAVGVVASLGRAFVVIPQKEPERR
ncbi:hypothetical protein [Haloplanus natans]|uniref:hypothetical protein n=1 Tax=Haloplanus natans TaxID=376171 RepID=UPI000677A531|nr:hypothetical protein [Haloplanus natans]